MYRYDLDRVDTVPIEETAAAIKELLDSGKIRAYGLSNENAFGTSEWVHAADRLRMPRPATIQNSYSLLCRGFESSGLAEACSPRHYNIGLLPWSVLCGGLLSGKYAGRAPIKAEPSSRLVRFGDKWPRWGVDATDATKSAVERYADIACSAGWTPAQLAVQWCRTRPFCAHGSVIVGASSVAQLAENLDAFALPALLDASLVEEIDAVHILCRDPSDTLY